MRISNAFPSNYLKAADLNGRTANVRMSHVTMEDIGGDHKPVLYFQGKEKGMVLNKTNTNNISTAYGDETNDWAGQPVELFTAWVDFQGKSVEAIRIRIPRGNAPAAHPNAPATVQHGQPEDRQFADADFDSEIPF
jgi:hypothetical protein